MVMEIGCIECCEDSKLVGIFKTPEEAERVATSHIPSPRHNGEIHVEVFYGELE